jgi:hypothetical protein
LIQYSFFLKEPHPKQLANLVGKNSPVLPYLFSKRFADEQGD